MSVNDVYEIILYALNKNQGGSLSPAEFNRVINLAQDSFLEYLLDSFNKQSTGFGQNASVRQRLTPVIYGYNLTIDVSGFSRYPADYERVDTMWSIYGFSRIRPVEQHNLYSYYNSVIDPVATNPIYLIEELGFRFYPTTTGQARLSYVRTPPRIVWNYTEDENDREVYTASGSVDPIWSDTDMIEVIARALMLCGVNLQASHVYQYAERVKNGED